MRKRAFISDLKKMSENASLNAHKNEFFPTPFKKKELIYR